MFSKYLTWFLDKYGKVPPTEEEGYYVCSFCWMKNKMPDLMKPDMLLSVVSLGISPEIRAFGDEPCMRQYHKGEIEPLLHATFQFCPFCSPAAVDRFFWIVSECSGLSEEYLLGKPDQPNAYYGLGHHITLIEYVPGCMGRYFNIQVNREMYRELVEKHIPTSIIYLHFMLEEAKQKKKAELVEGG